jgi:hypothetical protein
MEFVIAPYVGVGPIKFGLTREEVRQRLGAPVESFMKAPFSAAPADAFDTLGIHVHYGSDERCQAVEFYRSLTGPTFRGQPLFGKRFGEIERWLRTIDPDVRSDSSGLTSLAFGFGLYAPSALNDPQSEVSGAIAFRRGYYDHVRQVEG